MPKCIRTSSKYRPKQICSWIRFVRKQRTCCHILWRPSITLTTTRRNVWTVVGKHNSYMQGVGFQAYAPIVGASSNGYIQMSGFKPRDMVMHYTAHFMQRYKERYIDHYQIDRKGENLFEYFVYNNPQVLYTLEIMAAISSFPTMVLQ